MLKAIGTRAGDGRKTLFLGLSFGNLKRFKAHPGDTYIRIDGQELGLDCDVLIFSGKDEDHLVELMNWFGPGTRA